MTNAEAASLRTIQGAGVVLDVAVSPDSRSIASGGTAGTVTVWDSTTLSATKTLPPQEADRPDDGGGPGGGAGPGDDAGAMPNDEPAQAPGMPPGGAPGGPGGAPGGMDGGGNFQNYVMSLAFSPNGKVLAVGYNDGSITFWNQETGAITNTGAVHRGTVHTLAFSPDGKWMASGANSEGDDLVKLWNMENGGPGWAVPNLKARVLSVAFSPDSTLLACASVDGVVTLADVTVQQTSTLSSASDGNYAWSLAFSPDGSRLAAATFDNEIKVWDTRTRQNRHVWKGSAKPDDGITAIAYAPDGKSFAISNGHNMRGPLELRNAETGEIVEELCPETGHGKIAFAPNGKFLVIGSRDSIDTTLSIYDLE